MNKLYIDTCVGSLGLAVESGGLLFKTEEPVGKRTAEALFPTLEKILEEAKLSLRNIESVFVTKGPGSYTGERLGMTLAKIMATLNPKLQVYTISTLTCLITGVGKEVALLDARNQAYFAGYYEEGRLLEDEHRASKDEIDAKIDEGYRLIISKYDHNAEVSLQGYSYRQRSILEGMLVKNDKAYTLELDPLLMTPVYMHGKDRDKD